MKKYLPLIFSVVSFLFIFFVPLFTTEMWFKTIGEKIIASLLLGIFINTFQLFAELDKHKDHTTDTIKDNIERIVTLLKIQNKYYDDEWLFNVLNDLVHTVELTSNNAFDLERIQNIVDNALQESKAVLGTGYSEEKLPELMRISKLNDALSLSRKHVYAVTIDVRNYFDNFFSEINHNYIKLNTEAIAHGATIHRIFVMDNDIFKKVKSAKSDKFWKLVSELKKGESKMHIYFADKEKVLLNGQIQDTSFFLSDGIISSESGEEENTSNGGNYSINEHKKYTKLYDRYKIIKGFSTEYLP